LSESEHPAPAPPAGEEVHLPGPSILPLLAAVAITLIVVGTTISLIISVVGLVALVIIVWRWVGDTRRDIANLPEEHGH
jgi:Flp pilus assembly protein TadB